MGLLNLGLAREGWDNLKKIGSEGWDGLVDVFTPDKDSTYNQIRTYNNERSVPKVVVETVPEVITTIPETTNIGDAGPASLGDLGPIEKEPEVITTIPETTNIGDAGPAPGITQPAILPDGITDTVSKYGKYIKYAAIGGAALLAVSILRR